LSCLPSLRPRAASDTLPSLYAWTFTDTPAGGSSGVNVALARRAYGFDNGGAAWVIPANDNQVCIVAENAQAVQMNAEPGPQPHTRVPGASDDVSCEAAASIATGWPLAFGSSPETPGEVFTAGLVPDGVSQITIGTLAGASVTFAAHDNVWFGDLPGVPDSESFTAPSGSVNDTWAAIPLPTVSSACRALQAEHRGGVC
jgi:hypothetical protein